VKKYFGYCRVSTENQKDDKTIQYQIESIKQFAKNNGIEISQIFSDEAVSGSIGNRPGLAQLLYQIEHSPDIEGVLIYRLDRLARDVVLQENLIKTLQNLGKRLISTMEPDLDSSDPTRKMIRQILGVIAEYEKALITMRLSAGRLLKAGQGGYAGGGVPFGYKADRLNHRLAPDEAEAKTVRRIWYLRRYKKLSYGKIADTLNDDGIATQKGKKWAAYTIWYVLNNPVYRGFVRYRGVRGKGSHEALL